MKPFRILITGDRNWYAPIVAVRVMARLFARFRDSLVIVHGGATGVDQVFSDCCRIHAIPEEVHSANWSAFGRAAGPIRNAEMVASHPEFCIAVHRALFQSRGTKDCVRRCLNAGIPVFLIDSEEARGRRIRSLSGPEAPAEAP